MVAEAIHKHPLSMRLAALCPWFRRVNHKYRNEPTAGLDNLIACLMWCIPCVHVYGKVVGGLNRNTRARKVTQMFSDQSNVTRRSFKLNSCIAVPYHLQSPLRHRRGFPSAMRSSKMTPAQFNAHVHQLLLFIAYDPP